MMENKKESKKCKEVSEFTINNNDDKWIYEQVYLPKQKKTRFAYYRLYRENKKEDFKEVFGYVDEIEFNGEILKPIEADEVYDKKIILPEGYTRFESENKLFEEIKEHIHKYLDISEDFEVFSSWYIMLTWVYDDLDAINYLRVLGTTGVGKSRFLEVVGTLCRKAIMVAGALTSAPIYRVIKKWQPSLLIDEADFKNSDTAAEIIKILNCGFERNKSVMRCDKEDPSKIDFLPVFCPKVLATRRRFYDEALESRCLTEVMTQTNRKDLPDTLPRIYYNERCKLIDKLLMFRFKKYWNTLSELSHYIDLGDLEPRLKQATRPFVTIFHNNKEMMDRLRNFLQKYQKELIEDRSSSYEGMIVNTLYNLMENGEKNISPTMIKEYMENQYGLAKVNTRGIGKALRGLKLSTKQKRFGDKVIKVVTFSDLVFEDLVKRFVSKVSSVSSVLCTLGGREEKNNNKRNVSFQAVHHIDDTNDTNDTQNITSASAKAVLDEEFTFDEIEEYFNKLEMPKEYGKEAIKIWLDKGLIYEFKPKRYRWL